MTVGGELHMALAFNPSHLETVSRVGERPVKARRARRQDDIRDSDTPLSMQGAAALARLQCSFCGLLLRGRSLFFLHSGLQVHDVLKKSPMCFWR